MGDKAEDYDFELVELLKDKMNSRMDGLLLTSPLTSFAEFKKEGLRVDRLLKKYCEKHAQHYKAFLIVQKF